jgi:hypothetical protein
MNEITNTIKLISSNSPHYPLSIGCNEKYTEVSPNIKFIGLQINTHLNLKNHIDQAIPKLHAACKPSQTSLVFGCMYLLLLCLHLLGTIWMMAQDDIEVYLLQNMQTPIRIYELLRKMSHT